MPEDWFDRQDREAARPTSLVEQARGEFGAGGEIRRQVERFGRGALETAKTAGTLIAGPGRTKALGQLGSGIAETIMGPVRELGGIPQPGETAYEALPFAERPFAALGMLFGADPARVRQLQAIDPGGAWAARLTGPIITLGLGELLGRAAGKRLPSAEVRANKLAFASGDLPRNYQEVLPLLEETAKTPMARPAGFPERKPWHTGPFTMQATPNDLLGHVNATMARKEQEFAFALQPIAANKTVATSVADAIRSTITPNMLKTAEGKRMAKYIQTRAVEFDKPWSYLELNEERMRLFRLSKSPKAERAALRAQADTIADTAAEKALRDVVYGEVERTSGRPGYFRNLKRQESILLDIHDQLVSRIEDLERREGFRKGAPMRRRLTEKVTAYFHPAEARASAIIHPFRGPTGITMKEARRAVRESFVPGPRVGRYGRTAGAALLGRVPVRKQVLDWFQQQEQQEQQ